MKNKCNNHKLYLKLNKFKLNKYNKHNKFKNNKVLQHNNNNKFNKKQNKVSFTHQHFIMD